MASVPPNEERARHATLAVPNLDALITPDLLGKE